MGVLLAVVAVGGVIEFLPTAAGKPGEIVVYPDAGHAFHADYRPSYVPQDSADGEKRMYAWFKAHGVA